MQYERDGGRGRTQGDDQRAHGRAGAGRGWPGPASRCKWVALTNPTMGALLATIDASIMIIAMPDIFRGIRFDPLVPGVTAEIEADVATDA